MKPARNINTFKQEKPMRSLVKAFLLSAASVCGILLLKKITVNSSPSESNDPSAAVKAQPAAVKSSQADARTM